MNRCIKHIIANIVEKTMIPVKFIIGVAGHVRLADQNNEV